jgi:hypothetical protein
MLEFKNIRDAVMILAYFQHKSIGTNTCILGFGCKERLDPK